LTTAGDVPKAHTLEQYGENLIKACLNGPESAQDLYNCLRETSNNFAEDRLRNADPQRLTNKLTCVALHQAYQQGLRDLSRHVRLPQLGEAPTCLRYAEAAERLIDDIGQRGAMAVPFRQTAQACNDTSLDDGRRIEACAQLFGAAYWLDQQRRQCERYTPDRLAESYPQVLRQHIDGIARQFGDEALGKTHPRRIGILKAIFGQLEKYRRGSRM